jgi:(2Fe-2S) ferredoxin
MSKDKVKDKLAQQSTKKSKLSILEGQVMQWVDRLDRKQLLIATNQGEVVVKLSKALRHYLATMTEQKLMGALIRASVSYRGDDEYKAHDLIFADTSIDLSKDLSSSIAQVAQKPQQEKSGKPNCILVCGKSNCERRGTGAVITSLEEVVKNQGLETQVKIKATGCLKKCKEGVVLVFMPDKVTYTQVQPKQVSSLVTKHFSIN